MTRPRVACLLPARNAAGWLPGWFESVERFADVVVSLDDGSTDATAEILEDYPVVATVLRNPRRDTFEGWDDSANRRRLLAAAAELSPDWIISIDADERVAPESATRLRRFIDERAVPGIAYGFGCYRMIGDNGHHDGIESRVYRLFAFDPAHDFPTDRLHFNPVPTSIPRGRWLVTDIGIQHLSGRTDDLRAARRQKFAEADPHRQWATGDSDKAVGMVRPWRSRPPDDPVVLTAVFSDLTVVESEMDWPVLSIVLVIGDGNFDQILALMDQLADHETPTTELLIVALEPDIADDVARCRPTATVIRGDGWSSAAQARNIGLRVSRGDYVLLLDTETTFTAAALSAIVAIHDRGNAVLSFPAIVDDAANADPAVAGHSFARASLMALGGFDVGAPDACEHVARDRLLLHGHHVGHSPLVTVRRRGPGPSTWELVRYEVERGRALGRDGDISVRAAAQADRNRPASPSDAVGLGARCAGLLYERAQRPTSKQR